MAGGKQVDMHVHLKKDEIPVLVLDKDTTQ